MEQGGGESNSARCEAFMLHATHYAILPTFISGYVSSGYIQDALHQPLFQSPPLFRSPHLQ